MQIPLFPKFLNQSFEEGIESLPLLHVGRRVYSDFSVRAKPFKLPPMTHPVMRFFDALGNPGIVFGYQGDPNADEEWSKINSRRVCMIVRDAASDCWVTRGPFLGTMNGRVIVMGAGKWESTAAFIQTHLSQLVKNGTVTLRLKKNGVPPYPDDGEAREVTFRLWNSTEEVTL